KADNLVPNDANQLPDAFVYNRATGSVTLVNVGPNGMAADIANYTAPVISPDGRYVVFSGGYIPILPGPAGSGSQLYLRDLQTGTTSFLSANTLGQGSNSEASQPVFSADSKHVVFVSGATDLVAGFTGAAGNLFERNLVTGTITLVSADLTGAGV